MAKKFLSVEEIARELNVKKFIINFWEKEFRLKFERSGSGQKFYSRDDLNVFVTIKDLVHNKKMSLSQAKKQIQSILSGQENEVVQPEAIECATSEQQVVEHLVQPAVSSNEKRETVKDEAFMQNVREFREQLLSLKQLLDLE